MLSPYNKIKDADDVAVYEYKAIYVWCPLIICFVFIGFAQYLHTAFPIIALIFMVLYAIIITPQYLQIEKMRRQGSSTTSGSIWSFRNPLKVTISKTYSDVLE